MRLRRHDVWTLTKCLGCTHRYAALDGSFVEQLDSLYGHGYAGFQVDPVFARAAREFLDAHLRSRFPRGARVLDVGCGNGEFLSALVEAGYRAEGIDISEASAAVCRSRGLTVHLGDFPRCHLDSGFELVTFWDVLEHLPAPAEFVRASADRLGSGGTLLVKVPGHRWLSVASTAAWPRLGRVLMHIPHHIQFFTPTSLRRLLADAGFTGIEITRMGAMRGRPVGGTLRRRAGRAVKHSLYRASGDSNLLALAKRA